MPLRGKNASGADETTNGTMNTSSDSGKRSTVQTRPCNVQGVCAGYCALCIGVLCNNPRRRGAFVLVDHTLVTHFETDNTVNHAVIDYDDGEVVYMEHSTTIIHDGSVR